MKNEIAFRPQTRPGKIIILNIRRLGGIKETAPSPLIVFSSPSSNAASQLYAASADQLKENWNSSDLD